MKTIIRATVLVLALTGAAASSQISSATVPEGVIGKMSAMPKPTCPLNDPTNCGIGLVAR